MYAEGGRRQGREALALFEALVPPLVRRRISRGGERLACPAAERFPAALLLADISGFSALAESLARRGARGAEDLKDLLNLLFGRLVDLVDAQGGEVLKFAGDAALAMWPAGGLDEIIAVRQAAQCAVTAQSLLDGIESADGVRLHLRVGIGAGEAWAGNVGGVADRWELVLAGEPLEQAAKALARARPGEIGISAFVWSRIAPYATARGMGDGSALLEKILDPVDPRGAERIVLAPESEPSLRAYVPRAVQARLDAGQTDWLAEFRRASVLFIHIEGLDYTTDDVLDRLQVAVVAAQKTVYRYGGSVNQLMVDDKGTVMVCGWGLALHTHEDDAARAVRAAVEIRREIKAHNLRGSFGLAAGEIFTGLRGNLRRAEYAMIGSVVNLAARLMQAADGDVLCDAGTVEAAGKRLEFEALPALRVKGREQPVEVFRPCVQTREKAVVAQGIVGRAEERRVFGERLAALAAGSGSVVILEGEAGLGKSRLVADLVERARAQGIQPRVAEGDAIERSAPYHPWRALFEQLLGLESLTGPGEREGRVMELLSAGQLESLAAVLNPVLHLSFPETERTRSITDRGRAQFTQDLLIHLFRGAVGTAPAVLVLEDAHWFDSASWGFTERLCRQLQQLLVMIVMRPFSAEEQPAELRRLREDDRSMYLRLGALSAAEAGELVRRRLGADALEEPVVRLIFEKTEGHPYFAEELAFALRDRELIRVERGICRFATEEAARSSLSFPNTIQAVITSRIDNLDPAHQLTLKVASVLGRTFDLAALRAVHPIAEDHDELPRHLAALAERNLAHSVSSEPAPTYLFKHSITQEVCYGLLPFAQRRQLHQTVAQWYERERDDLSPWYALLAHHWSKAEVDERSVYYLDMAGEQAFGRYGNEEAARFFSEALAIDRRSGAALPAGEPVRVSWHRVVAGREAQCIRWERYLGEACMNLGKWDEAWVHLERTLALLGLRLPSSRSGWAAGFGTQVLVQILHQLWPRPARPLEEATASLLRHGARAYSRLGANAYTTHREAAFLFAVAAALNLAERLGPVPELALAYADVGNLLGLIPLHFLARSYGRSARRIARELGDPATNARVLGRSSTYRVAVGDWAACADVEIAMALADEVGDHSQWQESGALLTRAAQLRGEFERAAELAAKVYARAVASATAGHAVWALSGQAWALVHLGDSAKAISLAELGMRAGAGRRDALVTMDLPGAMALGHLHLGELDAARRAAAEISEELARQRRPNHLRILSLSACAETFLHLWEVEEADGRSATAEQARAISRAIHRYSRINPPARARAFLWQGCIDWLEGRQNAAHGSWRRCLIESARFGLPYEAARAHYEIGRRLGIADPARSTHLLAAEEGFGACAPSPT